MKLDGEQEVGRARLDRREVRCECGSLVAKLMGSWIELKCRRCKRLALIPLEEFKRAEGVVVRI